MGSLMIIYTPKNFCFIFSFSFPVESKSSIVKIECKL